MKRWFETLRFLWEEDLAPPGEVPRAGPREPAGVPRPLQRAAHFAFIGAVAVALMGQVIGVRLVAPVDAAPSYAQQCRTGCTNAYNQCTRTRESDFQQCQKNTEATFRTCKSMCPKSGKAADQCNQQCEVPHKMNEDLCQSQHQSGLTQCQQTRDSCTASCGNGP